MAENSIGGYTFSSLVGKIGGYVKFVEGESRPGINGHTFRELGKRGDRFQLIGKETFSSRSDAESTAEDYYKMVGTFVNIVKADRHVSKVMVLGVQTDIFPISASTDGNNYMAVADFTLQRAGE